jgi:hypothetical protein
MRLAPKDTGFDAEGRRRSGRVPDRPSYVDAFPQSVSKLLLSRRASAPARVRVSSASPSPSPLAGRKRKRGESPGPSPLAEQRPKRGETAPSQLAGQKRKRAESQVASSRPVSGRVLRRSLAPASNSKTPGPQRRTTLASRKALLASHWHDSPRSTRASRSFTGVTVFDLAESGPSLKLKSVPKKTKSGARDRRGRPKKKRDDSDDDDGGDGNSDETSDLTDPDSDSDGVDGEVASQLVSPGKKARRVTAVATLPTPPSTSESSSEHGLGRSRSASALEDVVTAGSYTRMRAGHGR